MQFLGIDLGSSSVKVSVFDLDEGRILAKAFYPKTELVIAVNSPMWAEQTPETWWESLKGALQEIKAVVNLKNIKAIGISYQMHGLVAIDKNLAPVRPAIIWCDSRAVALGADAFTGMGEDNCLTNLLNSPGNFTASKLAWVKKYEPQTYAKIWKFMLPGDYIALKLSGVVTTTTSGLSEGIFWDFEKKEVSQELLTYFGFERDMIPNIVPTVGFQCTLSRAVSDELGFSANVPITYRAGDQPNNAMSLNVLAPGELATTAGTSAVIYAVTQDNLYDKKSRINTFVHVNDTIKNTRNGVLLCVNGAGILYSWLKKLLNVTQSNVDYQELNDLSKQAPIGSDGLHFFPFGNGAERILENKHLGGQLMHVDFNVHQTTHIIRAAKEGIVFAMNYGLEIIREMGVPTSHIKAGNSNLFQSPLFRSIFVNTTQIPLALYDTDGAEGAARAASAGLNTQSLVTVFGDLKPIETMEPEGALSNAYQIHYETWKAQLNKLLKIN